MGRKLCAFLLAAALLAAPAWAENVRGGLAVGPAVSWVDRGTGSTRTERSALHADADLGDGAIGVRVGVHAIGTPKKIEIDGGARECGPMELEAFGFSAGPCIRGVAGRLRLALAGGLFCSWGAEEGSERVIGLAADAEAALDGCSPLRRCGMTLGALCGLKLSMALARFGEHGGEGMWSGWYKPRPNLAVSPYAGLCLSF